jgi:tRNA G18 (ribose-2'-O)-methylase SpoU
MTIERTCFFVETKQVTFSDANQQCLEPRTLKSNLDVVEHTKVLLKGVPIWIGIDDRQLKGR